ncbi:MAG: GIY-YIG nuclease family protein, partial [Nanoarchaeota archaeon]|nr:GIY-YIG nuclease family protein [Nanoarchaeota archaeon]
MLNLTALPADPGVYLFKDKDNAIIYVGKAINLKKRISSYFKQQSSPKTQLLVKHISDVECFIVHNEVEALLLENKLIKQHSPKYNINLKDSKTYAYIVVTDEPYPKIMSTRKPSTKGHLFGPFVDGSARRELIQLTVQLFKIRVCRTLPKKACLNYHIGLCTAPCIKNVNKEQYQQQVQQALEFLAGNTNIILKKLKEEMKLQSAQQHYEKALATKR